MAKINQKNIREKKFYCGSKRMSFNFFIYVKYRVPSGHAKFFFEKEKKNRLTSSVTILKVTLCGGVGGEREREVSSTCPDEYHRKKRKQIGGINQSTTTTTYLPPACSLILSCLARSLSSLSRHLHRLSSMIRKA